MQQHTTMPFQLHIGLMSAELTTRHGWASHSFHLIEALLRAGAQVTALVPRSSPRLAGAALHRILPETNPAERGLLPKQAALIPQARSLLRAAEVIHATIEPYAPLAAWTAGRRPLFMTGHGSYVQTAGLRRWPISTVYARAFRQAHIICVSHYTESVVHTALPGAQTAVIPNGVNAELFAAAVAVRRSAPPHPLTVLAVGAVKRRKGMLELVQAMAVVRRSLPEAQAVIIGSLTSEPDYVAQVQAAIRDLGLEGAVHLRGHVPEADLRAAYAQADVFALPSLNQGWKFEGYGIVYLEAGAAGLPVIGTRDCGAEDAIEDGVTGLLIPQTGVAESLPAALLRLLNDADLRARMGAAGLAKATRQSWDWVAAQWVAAYRAGREG